MLHSLRIAPQRRRLTAKFGPLRAVTTSVASPLPSLTEAAMPVPTVAFTIHDALKEVAIPSPRQHVLSMSSGTTQNNLAKRSALSLSRLQTVLSAREQRDIAKPERVPHKDLSGEALHY